MIPSDFWFPWFPALYAGQTLHLTLEQDAIYRRLIDRYMTTREPLPSHSQAVANICMISLDKWLEHKDVIMAFFYEKGGVIHHKRCDIELDRQDSYSKRMSDNAKKAAEKRKQNQRVASGGMNTGQDKTGQENLYPKKDIDSPPTPSPEGTSDDKPKRIRKQSTHIDDKFAPDLDGLKLASDLSIDIEQTTREFIDYWKSCGKPMCDWQAAFRNRLRQLAKYRAERAERQTDGRRNVQDVVGATLRVIKTHQPSPT